MNPSNTARLTAERTTTAQTVVGQANNLDLPPWLRVALWCWAHADGHGHARVSPAQLRRVLGLARQVEVSRAIRLARERNLIDGCSTSSCLVVVGHAIAPCEAQHRAAL